MTNGEVLGKKLYELRKRNGLSQEELAERLGVSRQAVSKWECGESLPDTDNLITIAKMYAISLDELVGNTNTVNRDTVEDSSEEERPYEENEAEIDDEEPAGKKSVIIRVLYSLPYPVLVSVMFLIWGFMWGGFYISWTLFITVPIYYSLVECIKTKRIGCFAYPVFATFVYLFIGMEWGLWHPGWIIYITIPIFYAVADAIDRR